MPYLVLDSPAILRKFKMVGIVLDRTDRLTIPGGKNNRNPWHDWIPSQMPVLLVSAGDDSDVIGWRAGDWPLKDAATLENDISNRMARDGTCVLCGLKTSRPDWVAHPELVIGHPNGPNASHDIYLVGCGHHACSKGCFRKLPHATVNGQCGLTCPECKTFSKLVRDAVSRAETRS